MKLGGLLNKELTVFCTLIVGFFPLFAERSWEDVVTYHHPESEWEEVSLNYAYGVGDNWRWLPEAEIWIYIYDFVEEIPGLEPIDFALIPAGTFEMGDHLDDVNSSWGELPKHEVMVSAFYMATHEVTKAQWDDVREWAIASGLGYTDLPEGGGRAVNHPVQKVSWYDVVKWLNAWSEKEGLKPVYTVKGAVMRNGKSAPHINYAASGYRLPTEAEWEKAARGGLPGERFPWGETITHNKANYHSRDSYPYDVSATRGHHPDYNKGNSPYTSPVGSFPSTGYGLHDMIGNVYEWCNDWHSTSYYSDSPSEDPKGPASGTNRVVRGGSWYDFAFGLRLSNRNGYSPSNRYGIIGFRPVRSSIHSSG